MSVELPADDLPFLPETLTAEATRQLRRPFGANAIEYRPLGRAGKDSKVAVAFYIDARLVVSRLNQVVGAAGWTDDYEPLLRVEAPGHYFPVQCALTVLGVTKRDVGQWRVAEVGENAWKGAYSDALKRAAVKFGVGAFLYSIPRIRVGADVDKKGTDDPTKWRTLGVSREGQGNADAAYQRWLANTDLNTFGPALDADPYPAKEGDDHAGE